MAEFSTVWQDNSPDSLLDLVIKFCVQSPHTFCNYISETCEYELREGLSLPEEICERILCMCCELNRTIDDKLLTLFKDSSRTRLRRVKLRSAHITDASMEIISKHNITELDISNCTRLTARTRKLVSKVSRSLLSLIVGNSVGIFSSSDEGFVLVSPEDCFPDSLAGPCGDEPSSLVQNKSAILDAPHLRKLVVHNLEMPLEKDYFPFLLEPLQFLTYLDLSNCQDLGDLNYLETLKNLTSLILYNVVHLQDAVPSICLLKSLRHLDISQSEEQSYENPNQVLRRIVESLSNLLSLDISGTNLAGKRFQEREDDESLHDTSLKPTDEVDHLQQMQQTDIPGLKSRVNRPLEFLGLFSTAHEACYRHHVPAKRIAGNANEDQILTAAQVYCERTEQIQKVLNDLFHVFRYETCRNTKLALDVVIQAMNQHVEKTHIQISGSASLFYIVKGEVKDQFNIKVKRTVIRTLLNAMSAHIEDVTMLRNSCLTLIHFKIPDDVLFEYERLVKLLLYIVVKVENDEFVQRIAVYLLNSLACQVDGIQKELVGDLGAVSVMLRLIKERLDRNQCDEVMETAWSTMWNVTDETPINCQRFLDGGGMDLFLDCLTAYPEKPELLRNMMGLLGNVAEVKDLRARLMQNEYLATFSKLLDSTSDGIEVSYNAAGILAHIASDGPGPWYAHNITSVTRGEVLSRMKNAIDRWDLNTKRNINYRSFEPILRLLSAHHAPEAQHWAVWALANLTKVYPDKYCPLLVEENGIKMLKDLLAPRANDLLSSYETGPDTVKLAVMIIYQCERYKVSKSPENSGNSNADEDSD